MLDQTERTGYDARFAALWSVDPVAVIPPSNRHAVSVTAMKPGGMLRIGSEVFVVTKTATTTETDDKFKKTKDYIVTELVLFSLQTGETRYLEWVVDDGVEITLTERKLSQKEISQRLTYDDGEIVDVDDMDEIVEKKWELVFQGKTYDYDDDWPALYQSSDGRKSMVYSYEFGDAKTGWLTVEAWSADGKESGMWDYEVYLSRDLAPSQIEVIVTG